MRAILSAIGSAIEFRFRSRASLEVEVIALRHQLSVLRRRHKAAVVYFPLADRFFWGCLYKIWPRALEAMVLVKPATVIKWHYAGFRLFWRWKCKGRPWRRIAPEIRDLIWQIKRDNPLWGRARITAELGKLGYQVSPQTVMNYLPNRPVPPSPGWKVFLRNHMRETMAVDFFVVVTVSLHLLYGMVVISHSRRKILRVGVTAHPTQDWAAQQIRECFPGNPKPKFLLRDRDAIYGRRFRAVISELGIKERITKPRSPWQNIYAERVIGSIRRECLDHIIVFNERHLARILEQYADYYNYSRTHYSLDGDSPVHRPVQRPVKGKKVVAIPQVGGLHHRYERRAA